MAKKEDGTLHVIVARTARVVLQRLMPAPGVFTVQQNGAKGSKTISLSRMLGVRKGAAYEEFIDLPTGVIVLQPVKTE